MAEKIKLLRALLEDVEPVSLTGLAERWGVTRQAARQLMVREGAPEPLWEDHGVKYYALPECEAFRTRRMRERRGHHA